MGASDSSFIKAYDSKKPPVRRRAPLSGVYVDQSAITVATPQMEVAVADRDRAVSHLYAAADRIRTREGRRTPITSMAAARAVPANQPGIRVDGLDPVMPPAPHLPMKTLTAAAAAESFVAAEAPATSPVPAPSGAPGVKAVPAAPAVAPIVIPVPTQNSFPQAGSQQPPQVEQEREAAISRIATALEDREVVDDVVADEVPVVMPPSRQPEFVEPSPPTEAPASPIHESEEILVLDDESIEHDIAEPEITEPEITEPWRAQWEVDALVWPEVVEELTEQWAGELSALIRPLLTSAWQGQNVIAVTSFNRGEGATTMAMCLARMAASFRVPVAVIDGDLVDPSIGERMGLAFGQGWNTLPPALPLSEAAIASAQDDLVVIPGSRHHGMNVAGSEASVAYHALDELANNFELVILDAGPIFTAAHRWFDGPSAEKIHGTLIVQDVRATSGEQIEDVCARLGEVGMDQVAIVENFRAAA